MTNWRASARLIIEVINMNRELDIAVAKALGLHLMRWTHYPEREPVIITGANSSPIPQYCVDANAMLDLLDKMQERGWYLEIQSYLQVGKPVAKVCFSKFDENYEIKDRAEGSSDTLPHAVTLAAYKALNGESWHEIQNDK